MFLRENINWNDLSGIPFRSATEGIDVRTLIDYLVQ